MIPPSSKLEGFSTVPNVKWDDVGGLQSLKLNFERHIVKPITFPEVYKDLGVFLKTNFLLDGPSGCGKTLIVEALANEAGANFMHIKCPELLRRYGDQCELVVHIIFNYARTCSPCILFFDELDDEGLWPVLEQLLPEVRRRGVYVIFAINRHLLSCWHISKSKGMNPLRFFRNKFHRFLAVPLPSPEGRGAILKALARNKPIDANVDLMALGKDVACEKFSGADLSTLCDARHDDRISELPDEIKVVILSSLQLREAAAASVLSSPWLNLWKNTSNLKFDRISKLPDQIIVLILSFLPLRDAARTSVLSSRWPHLWKCSPNLNFKLDTFARGGSNLNRIGRSWELDKCKYVQLVNSVLQSHKAPSLKQFSISFRVDKSAQLYVTKWLEFVFSRQVERLELNFQGVQQEYMAAVELEEMLRESRICTADVILSKSLKSLRLNAVKVSGEAIEWILCSCLLLEELIISSVFLTSDVEVCGANLMLKHLEIYFLTGEKSIKISTPNLTQLTVGDTSGKLLLENVSKHVRAHIVYASGRPDNVQTFTSGLFSLISFQLTILTLSLKWAKIVLANEFPEMPNLKKLFLRYCDAVPKDFLPLTALIWASPRLEEFKLEFRVILFEQYTGKKVKPNLERSVHQHLKVFELTELVDGDGENVKELVTYIVNNCIALQKITFSACSWFHYCEKFHDIISIFEAEDYAMQVRDHAKQQLQDELPQHIQLEFL